MRATNRRPPPSTGNRWLVSDQVSRYGLRQSPGLRESVAVTEDGGSTRHGTVPDVKDNSDTEMGSAKHVSSLPSDKTNVTDSISDVSTLGQAGIENAANGLIISEQKRKRAEVEGPSAEPNFMDMELSLSELEPVARRFGIGEEPSRQILVGGLLTGETEWNECSIEGTFKG
nr:uncharacterized protein LOC109147766 [Ipomoea batatas]